MQESPWALFEGHQIINRSPSFPENFLESLKTFLCPHSLPKAQAALTALFHKHIPFQIRVRILPSQSIYIFSGRPFGRRFVFWLKDITQLAHQERHQAQLSKQKEILLAQLHRTLNLLPIPIWCRDKHQKVTYCNKVYAKSVRASPEIIYEKGIELIPLWLAKPVARRALHTKEFQTFESHFTANEKEHYFRIIERPQLHQEGTIGVAFDITDLKEGQATLQELKETHNKILGHLSLAITIYDEDCTLQYYNPAYINLHGLKETFLKSRPHFDEVLEELRRRRQLPECINFLVYKKERLQKLKEQVDFQEEFLHLPDERTLRSWSAPCFNGGFFLMFEDLTQYYTLERKHNILLETQKVLLEKLFEGILIIGSDNRLKFFNQNFLQLWNLEQEGEIKVGEHLSFFVEKLKTFFTHKKDWETYKMRFIAAVTDRIPKEGKLQRNDTKILKFVYIPLPDGDHLLSYTDITDKQFTQYAIEEKKENYALSL